MGIYTKLSGRKSNAFTSITVGLASPEQILERSKGEVLKPETINYRSYKPEKDGLFCEKIFGPVKDWECHCGKYKRIRYRGIICDRCGVEVTRKTVRRERMGHITLAVPVVHIWFFRSIPSKISNLLGYTTKQLESCAYYEKYVITNAGPSGRTVGELIDENEFLDLDEEFGFDVVSDEDRDADNYFEAYMGGEGIRRMLKNTKIEETVDELTVLVKTKKISAQKREAALKRLRILKKFDGRITKKIPNKPEWMVLSILPVIPPELRPLVPLDGGRFAASDLNDLYRRVIIRNNRLKKLMEIKAPDVILRNEKRMLQEAVDALLDNSRLQAAVRSGTRRPLKSLSDALKGKTGRFRQNLLGKRVDYSGRSVIVVGPDLALHECGIPKGMVIELFKPMIVRELIQRNYARTPKTGKLIVEAKRPEVFEVLEYVVRDHPILLNRAPTLHRLGIQAFQPVLIDGKAIQLHPLVCSAFNADFDGDQMAVHVPLSEEAKAEAWLLMLSSHNILHPANGRPIAIPSQDMVLGFYYLTRPMSGAKGEGMLISSVSEAVQVVMSGVADLHAIVSFRAEEETKDGFKTKIFSKTTIGRIFFNDIVPKGLGYKDLTISKKVLGMLIGESYRKLGNYETIGFLDRLKDLGFEHAFKSGTSIAISDIHIPSKKPEILENADKEVQSIQNKFDRHLLTSGERYNKIIDIWTHTTARVASEMFEQMKADRQGFNPLYMMADSGARGSQDQIKQLAGMRGLMAKPKKTMTGSAGEIIENPIKSNFKEGLSVFEYFISTHGARKGLADTALKTADAGYLTRRLVDVAQDVVITIEDCGTAKGILMKDLIKGEDVIEPLSDRIFGRTLAEDVFDPVDDVHIASFGELVTHDVLALIESSNVYEVMVRSIITCDAEHGICSKCYGLNLATNRSTLIGDAVGIMAAQSIGEPGTQLTLRTFHIGGAASKIIEQTETQARKAGKIRYSEYLELIPYTDDSNDGISESYHLAISRNGAIDLLDDADRVLTTYKIPYASRVYVENNAKVAEGAVLFSWDPYSDVILARKAGMIRLKDIIEGETFVEEAVEGGKKMIVITESKNKNLNPHIEIESEDDLETGMTSMLPVRATVMVRESQEVKAGDVLVKIPRDSSSTRDITGGLPRIAELFEARNPSNPAVITEIDGTVKFGRIRRGIREIHVSGEGQEKTYKIPYGKHVIVHQGDYIFAGDKLIDGAVSPRDILEIKGPSRVQEYLVDSIQEVYRLQGVSINDKHIEIIVRQMMQKVIVEDSGDSDHLPGDRINRVRLEIENLELAKKLVITNPGASDYLEDQIAERENIEDMNAEIRTSGKEEIEFREAKSATYKPLLLGITRASLNTESFISAASFQETTRVLTDAAVEAKTDHLLGLKENVIIGRLIPAGTGVRGLKTIKPFVASEENSDSEQ